MKKVEYWEAEDGERFETEAECIAYENRFAELDKHIVFFNSKYEKLTGNFLSKIDDCWGMFIPNAEDAIAIDKIFVEEGYESPFHRSYKREPKAGHYYYANGWCCLEEEKARVNEIETNFAKGRGLI